MSDDRLEFLSTGELDFSDYDPEDLVTATITVQKLEREDGKSVLNFTAATDDEASLVACLSDEQHERRDEFKAEQAKDRMGEMVQQIANYTDMSLAAAINKYNTGLIQPSVDKIIGDARWSMSDAEPLLPPKHKAFDPGVMEIPELPVNPTPGLLGNVVEELQHQSELNTTQNDKLEALAEAQKDTSTAQEKHAKFDRRATITTAVLAGLTLLVAVLTLGATLWTSGGINGADDTQRDVPSSTQEESP